MSAAPEPGRVPIVGLTGAIAAGKSEALAAFGRLGAATLSSDAVVHELLGTDRVRDLLVGRWGEDLAPDGEVDRARVAEIVFARPDELAWLEQALHPLVGERIAAWYEALTAGTAIAVVEVPLLFEAGLERTFDATVAVVARDETRAARAGEREAGGLEGREARQLSQAEKAARADHVIENDGTVAELEAKLEGLIGRLTAREAGDG